MDTGKIKEGENDMIIIGVAGDMYAGKSTATKILVEEFEAEGKKVLVSPFAGPLKELAKEFGWDGKKDDKGRLFLQTLGTEIGRQYDTDFWVKKWVAKLDGYDVVIADDCRFPNELAAVTDRGGFVIKIKRKKKKSDDILRMTFRALWKWLKYVRREQHASEKGFKDDEVNHIIENYGSLEEFESTIHAVVNNIKDHYHE